MKNKTKKILGVFLSIVVLSTIISIMFIPKIFELIKGLFGIGFYFLGNIWAIVLKSKYMFISLFCLIISGIFVKKKKYKIAAMIFLICSIIFGICKFQERNIMFKFENYSSAEKAQNVLLELHPIGNPVEKLVERMEKLGAKCGPITNPEYKDKPEYKNLIYCVYYEREIIFATKWMIIIKYDDDQKIQEIKISSGIDAI